jgi:predicted transcriptional regulator
MAKTAPFSMRLEEDLKETLQHLADADNRSLTNYIETVLRQHVAETERKRTRK